MGLFGALFAGVSGLDSQSNAIGVISNNISNVNTVGYKQGSASFATLVVPSGTTGFSPGGVIGSSNQLVNQQGLIQATSSATDIAITGGGLMVVSTTPSSTPGGGNYLYTRAGSFTQDSSGNFVNADGYFLQGLPLLANGSTQQPQSSNLVTVNVNQSQTGTATSTSVVSLAANLNSQQAVFAGSHITSTMSTQFGTSASNAGISGDTIIVGNNYDGSAAVSGLVRGNTLLVTSNAVTDTFTYGGFTVGRSVLLAAPGNDGDGGNTTVGETLASGKMTVTNTGATTTTSAITGIDVTSTSADATTTGGFLPGGQLTVGAASITISATGGESLTQIASDLQTHLNAANGTSTSTVVVSGSPGNYTLTVNDTSGAGKAGFTGAALTNSPKFTVVAPTSWPSATQMTIQIPTPGGVTGNVAGSPIGQYQVGSYLNVSGLTAGVGNLTTAQANGEFKIVAVDATNGTVTVETGVAATVASGSNTTSATITNRTYNFTGNILNAKSATDDFIAPSGASTTSANFASDSLHFNITIGSNPPLVLSYNQNPDVSSAQFNNLTTLAAAINDSSAGTATATVVNGRLYVSATDANQAVSFSNGDVAGNSGLPGINWVQELDLQNQAGGTTGVFNSLAGLRDQIKVAPSGDLTATLNTKTDTDSEAQITITEANPLNKVTFADGQPATSGSLLKELGIQNINTDSTGTETTNALPATYDPSSPLTDMSSGAVTPQHTFTVTVYDSQGNSHTLDLNMIKTGTNTWAAELTAVPANSVSVAGHTDGQLAFGTLTFHGDGTLASVSNSLGSTSIPITWTNGATPSSIQLNLKPTDTVAGVSQDNANYSLQQASQNGAPVGQLTGVSIDANGYVIASFSNGQTQKEYQIPLANIANPNGLQAVSGNAYSVTLGSGLANLAVAGSSGVGTFTPSALEESNVDLSTQLTNLIVAQQAYGAN
jgi:flagellar hook protein FlgE